MKKLSVSLLAACLFSLSFAKAQTNVGGVYLTASDFSNGKLSYPVNCTGRDWGSKADVSVTSKQVVINLPGKTYRADKKDVYAVKYCDGLIVRMYKDGYYPVLNPGEKILLYGVTQNPVSKGRPVIMKYYFSKDAGADIEELTLDNLRTAFIDNKQFQDALENQTRSDNDLYAYDGFHKMYKVNRILASIDK